MALSLMVARSRGAAGASRPAAARPGGARPPTATPWRGNSLRQRAVRTLRSPSLTVRAAGDDNALEAEDARGAIALGIKLYNAGKYEDACKLFTKVAKDQLPGNGIKRFRDKPPGVSEGEKMAALYNIACCYSQLGDVETGLAAFAGALESGFEDLKTARTDPDLAALREDKRFEGLLGRFLPQASSSGGLLAWLQYQLDFKNSAISRALKKPNDS